MYYKRTVAVTARLAVALSIAGCASTGRAHRSESGSRDSVKLVGVAPDPAVKLHPGQQVIFRVKLVSTLVSAETGHISLVIQDNSGRNLKHGGPQSRMGVGRGTENLELHDEGVVSLDARWVDVFVPLFPEGASNSTAAEAVRFAVVR